MSYGYLTEARSSVPPLSVVRHSAEHTALQDPVSASRHSGIWRSVAATTAAGILFGFAVAGWYGSTVTPAQGAQHSGTIDHFKDQWASPSVVIVPSASGDRVRSRTTADPAEMERLRTRNRRLEALVQVLQKRSQAESLNNGIAAHH